MKIFDLEIQWLNPAELTPYPLNNKIHPIEQIDELAGLIATFGFDQPIVVDENYIIIKGHGRREAALRLKLDKVPVIVRTDLTDEEKRASRLADNTVVGEGWNLPAIGLELDTLAKKRFDFTKIGLNSTSNATLKSFLEERQRIAEQLEKDTDDEYHEDKEYFGNDGYGSRSDNDSQNKDDSSMNSVKIVELFFSSITADEFQARIKNLNQKYGTANTTDCILRCLRECDSN